MAEPKQPQRLTHMMIESVGERLTDTRRLMIVAAVVIVGFCAATFGLTLASSEMSKESHVVNVNGTPQLQSTEGAPVTVAADVGPLSLDAVICLTEDPAELSLYLDDLKSYRYTKDDAMFAMAVARTSVHQYQLDVTLYAPDGDSITITKHDACEELAKKMPEEHGGRKLLQLPVEELLTMDPELVAEMFSPEELTRMGYFERFAQINRRRASEGLRSERSAINMLIAKQHSFMEHGSGGKYLGPLDNCNCNYEHEWNYQGVAVACKRFESKMTATGCYKTWDYTCNGAFSPPAEFFGMTDVKVNELCPPGQAPSCSEGSAIGGNSDCYAMRPMSCSCQPI